MVVETETRPNKKTQKPPVKDQSVEEWLSGEYQATLDNYTYVRIVTVKKNGKRKIRHTYNPAPNLKTAQKILVKELESTLSISELGHAISWAYRKKRNVVDMARKHVGKDYMLKVDLKNFFHSIDVRKHRSLHPTLTAVCGCVVKRGKEDKILLLQGAPSTPIISNMLMIQTDRVLSGFCLKTSTRNRSLVTVTRYSDDIVFSSDSRVIVSELFLTKVRRIFRKIGLSLNKEKTRRLFPSHDKRVCGINVNETEISAKRCSKRAFLTLAHRAIRDVKYARCSAGFYIENGATTPIPFEKLQGMHAWLTSVESDNIKIRAAFDLVKIYHGK